MRHTKGGKEKNRETFNCKSLGGIELLPPRTVVQVGTRDNLERGGPMVGKLTDHLLGLGSPEMCEKVQNKR